MTGRSWKRCGKSCANSTSCWGFFQRHGENCIPVSPWKTSSDGDGGDGLFAGGLAGWLYLDNRGIDCLQGPWPSSTWCWRPSCPPQSLCGVQLQAAPLSMWSRLVAGQLQLWLGSSLSCAPQKLWWSLAAELWLGDLCRRSPVGNSSGSFGWFPLPWRRMPKSLPRVRTVGLLKLWVWQALAGDLDRIPEIVIS